MLDIIQKQTDWYVNQHKKISKVRYDIQILNCRSSKIVWSLNFEQAISAIKKMGEVFKKSIISLKDFNKNYENN